MRHQSSLESSTAAAAVAESAAVRASSFWLRVRIAEGTCPRGATRVARRARVRNATTDDRRQTPERCTGDGAQLGVSSAHARALVAPPSLCIFHTAFIRRRMVLALVQDWASSAAVPLMGGPRVGATSNPRPGIRAEGAPDSSIRWAPVHSLELITLRSSRPFADWTAVRCVVALSCTLSCLVVVTRE